MSKRADVQYWVRLNHEGLGMPSPAVYIPRAVLPPTWPVDQRFTDVVDRDEDAGLPVAADVALDIADPAGARLIAVEASPHADPHARLVEAASVTELASGFYTEPSTQTWRDQAYAGGFIIVVTGPTPTHQNASPFQMLFSPGTRMGVVPLVAPNPM